MAAMAACDFSKYVMQQTVRYLFLLLMLRNVD